MAVTETSIDLYSDDKYVTVYTNDKTYAQKLKKLYKSNKEDFIGWEILEVEGEPETVRAKVPKKWFKFISAPKKVSLSEEEKVKRAERMAKARAARKQKGE
jgi:hypothetical protein